MEQFINPEIMRNMSFSEKLGDSLVVMGLGMSITFLVLLGLMVAIMIMSKVLVAKPKPVAQPQPAAPMPVEEPSPAADFELIAVLAAAVAQISTDSGRKLRIQSVRLPGAKHPLWYESGMQQQMNVNRRNR